MGCTPAPSRKFGSAPLRRCGLLSLFQGPGLGGTKDGVIRTETLGDMTSTGVDMDLDESKKSLTMHDFFSSLGKGVLFFGKPNFYLYLFLFDFLCPRGEPSGLGLLVLGGVWWDMIYLSAATRSLPRMGAFPFLRQFLLLCLKACCCRRERYPNCWFCEKPGNRRVLLCALLYIVPIGREIDENDLPTV